MSPTPDRIPESPSLGESISRHANKLILQYRNDLRACTALLIEAKNHAKLTQNLGLMRRIDEQLKGMNIL